MSGRDDRPFTVPDGYTPPEMPASMPTMVFMHNGNPTYHQLRGGPIFEVMQVGGYKVIIPDQSGKMSVPASGRLMVLMDLQVDVVDWVESLRDQWGSVVLVDVTGPVWDPARMGELEPGAREYWSDPDRQQAARHLIELADGVTTPHVSFTELLADLNEQVFVLPDLDEESDASVMGFMVKLNLAWHTAAEAKGARLREAAATSG